MMVLIFFLSTRGAYFSLKLTQMYVSVARVLRGTRYQNQSYAKRPFTFQT